MSERREPSSAAPRGRGSRAEGRDAGRRRGGDSGRGRGRAPRDEPTGGFFDDEPPVDLGWGEPDRGRGGPPPPWETPGYGGRGPAPRDGGRGRPPSTWDEPPRDVRRGWGEPTPPPWAQEPGFGPEPPWVRAQTEEWVPVGGQRFPGDRRMMRRAPTARGRAGVPPPPSAQVPPARRTPLDDPVSPAARPAASHPWRVQDAPVSPAVARRAPEAPAVARRAPEAPAARRAPEAPAARRAPEAPAARRAPEAPAARRAPEAPAARRAPEAPAARPAPDAPARHAPDAPARRAPEAPAARQAPPAPPAQGRAPRPPEREAPRPRRAPDVWDGLPPAAAAPPPPPPAPPAAPRRSLGELLRGAPDVPTEDWVAGQEPPEDRRPEPPPMAGWFASAPAPADAPASAPQSPAPQSPARPRADEQPAPKRPAAGPPALDLRLDYPSHPVSPAPPLPPAEQSAEPPTEAPTEPPTPAPADAVAEPVDAAPEEPTSDLTDDAQPEPTPAPADAATPTETTVDPADDGDATDAVPLEPDPAPRPAAEASPDTVLPVPEGTAAGAATAIRAPTALHPVIEPAERADASGAEPEDPERVLATYPWRFHHETLRELVENADELRTVRDRLTEKIDKARDNAARARLLSLRAVASRILGDLGKAQADGKLALAHAEATGELRRIAIAQARLAHVLQWRGDFAEADRLFAEANSPELPDRLRATMHEHAGRSCYDQGRYMEACNHFERALDLRKVDDPELIARTEVALDAVFAKVAGNGWGPYPRERDEILQTHRAPAAAFSEAAQCWGYDRPDGETAIPPSYAEVQPFREGVAWVRRPETTTWELIDESGDVLIAADAGYVGVGSFSDGLAWASLNGRSGWVAVDRTGRVAISTGFDDVRPFRRGVAAVKRGGWGAIDKSGRTVVPTQYTAFATALTDGRYVDGFTEEGLAVVDAGGRKGIVDRTGKVVLPPRFADLVIHPVAFLVGSGTGRWGALDRRGDAIIDPVHRSRADVMEEIDRLLADTKPVL